MEKNLVLEAEYTEVLVDDYSEDMNSEKAIMHQNNANIAWQQVYVTDFSKVEDVIDLFHALQPYGDNIYVQLPYNQLLSILSTNGYVACSYDKETSISNDKEVVGRYLVGRFMSYMMGEYLGLVGLPNAVSYDSEAFKNRFMH